MQASVNALLFLSCGLILTMHPLTARGQPVVLSGYVEDALTGERLPGATLYDAERGTGATTNRYGFYSLTLPQDTVRLDVSYVGYRDTTLVLSMRKDTWRVVRLQAQTIEVGEIEVSAESSTEAGISQIELSPEQIRELPALLGETDVLKALQLTPGVQGGMEGSAGIHVRGGSPDQNLILLDGAPVYNVNHLFGFFSVFNNDAIQRVKLIKGGFPARYGGRLSSVVDVTMKEGNLRELTGRGSVGLLSSRLTIEGPLVENKSSFIVSGRRTYADVITRPLYRIAVPGGAVGYYFYDLNAKANYILSDRTRAFVSAYGGSDRFYSNSSEGGEMQNVGLGWNNLTATVRLAHAFGPKLFGSLTLLHSRYRFGTSIEERTERREDGELQVRENRIHYRSGLRDWSARADLDYSPGSLHTIKVGASLARHLFRPDVLEQHRSTTGEAPLDTAHAERIRTYSWNAYAEDQLQIGPSLSARLGVHASAFRVDGRWYGSIQPRLSAGFRFADGWRARAAFTTMRQYVHLLTNGGVALPTDLWVPSTGEVGPEDAWQAGLGLERTFAHRGYELSLNGFYKEMDGVIAYKNGASFIETGTSWEEKVTSGTGQSYGAELFLRKKRGRTTGWLGYTLSWAWREFEEIGRGERFPYRYDRRHDLSFVVNHELSDRRSLSLTWVYKTGNAVTLPVAQYDLSPRNWPSSIQPGTLDYYGGRNEIRMRPYHRLDLAYRIRYPASWGEGELSFGLYNAYSRFNPFYMTLATKSEYDPEIEAYRTKYFYDEVGLVPVVPFISYRFTF